MATKTVTRRSLVKLDPPTVCDGITAEVAYITRFFEIDTDTDAEREYGVPHIEVVWGITTEQLRIALEGDKIKSAQEAEARAAQLDEELAVVKKDK